ncbi:MAG: 50S ribosomal protein L24 [Candidatus Liptonbacteria bacterium]|nr:50S ribosomal protein L24 [Candidatus Liptonbacteria bacterium]
MNIKKGDTVKILAGKDRGKTGKILKMLLPGGKVIVDGINIYKKHTRPKRQGEKGEVVSLPRPIGISNVQAVCQNCGKATRIGIRIDGEKKIRYCKKCEGLL